MGECISASIQFGGKLKQEHVDELIGLLEDKNLRVDFGESYPDPTNLGELFGNSDVNYGNLDELQDFGRTHGLHYTYWFDSGSEWEAQTERYDPTTGLTHELVSDNAITEADCQRLGSFDAIIDHFLMMKRPLPPLEIVL